MPSTFRLAGWLAATLPHCAWSCHVVVRARPRRPVARHRGRLPRARRDRHDLSPSRRRRRIRLIAGDQPPARRGDAIPIRGLPRAHRRPSGAAADPRGRAGRRPPTGAPDRRRARRPARQTEPAALGRTRSRLSITTASELGLRLYLGSKDRDASIMEILTAAHVLDSTMDRMDGDGPLLGPCRPHLVVTGGRSLRLRPAVAARSPRVRTGRPPGRTWRPDASLCAGCIADAVAGMGPEFRANLRQTEGRELALRTSAALLDDGSHNAAAEVARTAAELSRTRSRARRRPDPDGALPSRRGRPRARRPGPRSKPPTPAPRRG